MSDVNKIVAAILTAGRMPTLSVSYRMSDDWLAEYERWVPTLNARDAEAARPPTIGNRVESDDDL